MKNFNPKNAFMIVKICIFSLLILSISCSKNSTPSPSSQAIFTLIVPASINTSSSDDWIFATTLEGIPLDAEPYEAGQTITLRSNESLTNNQFNIHFFQKIQLLSPTRLIVTVGTFTGISTGRSWTLSTPSSSSLPGTTGTATLSVTNYSNPLWNTFTQDPNIIFSTINGPMPGTYSKNSSLLTANLELNNTLPTNVFVTALRNNVPVYLQLDGLSNSTSTSKDFISDFKPHETLITVSDTGHYYAYTSGFYNGDDTKNDGYYHSRYYNYGPATLAYADGFDTYKTEISILDKSFKRHRQYFKIGTKANSLTLPDVTVSISDSSIVHPLFSFNNAFNFANMKWAKTTTLNGVGCLVLWNMNTSGIPFTIQNIPDQILASYPFMSLDSFHYNGCTVTQYLDGFTYESHINSISDPNHTGEASKEYLSSSF